MRTTLTQTLRLVCNTQELYLHENKIGDAGMIKFSEVCAGGALASVTDLRLQDNQIGDEGMKAFSAALATGAMAHLDTLYIGSNPISDAAKDTMRNVMSNKSGSVQF